MEIREILARCDHTLLKQTAAWADIQRLCDEGLEWGVASVCIPPCYVASAAAYLAGRLPVCTVVGFPNGYSSSDVKRFETAEADSDGADEIDMVANIGWIKAGEYDKVRREIDEVRRICGARVLKVIIETTCSPGRRRSKCAGWSRTPARTISRPPPALPEAAPPGRTWPS